MTIQLLASEATLTVSQIETAMGDAWTRVVIADAYVEGAESWIQHSWGWRTNSAGATLDNVDHHAPVERMQCEVSSGNLAIEYVEKCGTVEDGLVLINHCDCDSIVAAAILSGRVQPLKILGEAVIAADHTGEPNEIADSLQPLESRRDLGLSLRTLQALLDGSPLEGIVEGFRDSRVAERKRWQDQIEMLGVVKWFDNVALIVGENRIPAELLTGLLPGAAIIVTSAPAANERWKMKLRLGVAAKGRFTLQSLDMFSFDPGYGGRWNAGSNTRGGGTAMEPHEYAARLATLIGSGRAV